MQQIEKQFSTQQNQQQQQNIQQQQQQKQAYIQSQPIQQQQNIKQTNASTTKLIEQEQMYTIVSSFKSFNLIQQECNFIMNTCMKQPSIESNTQCLAFYTNLKQALQKQLLQLIDFVEQGKLRDDMYGKFIGATFKDQYALLQKAQTQGDAFFIKRITNRMNILKAEQTLMQQNPSENFVQIVQKIKPNINIPQSQKPILRKPQLQDNIKLDSIKIDKNAQKHLEENIDQLPTHVKYEALLKRYKEYYNYATYLSNHAKVKRKEDIEQALKLLEKGKQLRELFTQGQNPPIGNYLYNEIKEITLEQFHQMNQQQYKSQQTQLFNQLMEANNKEKEFYKISLHSKRIHIGQNQTYNPHEESKQRLNSYGQAFEHLKSLQKMQWILLPDLETQDLQVSICIENKEVPPNIIRIKFRKLDCKYEKYYLFYSLDTNKGVVSKQTEICDKTCSFNSDHDIPMETGVDYSMKKIEVRLFEKGFFGSSEIGVGFITLENIKNKTLFEGIASITTPKKQTIQLSYTLMIREPIEKYTQLQIQFVQITKQYPVFDQQEGMKEFLEKFMVALPTYEQYKKEQEIKRQRELEEQRQREAQRIQEEKLLQEQQEAQQQSNNQQQQQTQLIFLNHMENNPEIQKIKQYMATNPPLPPKFNIEDLLYPENPNTFPVFSFIEEYQPQANQKSIELKQEPSLRQWSKFVQKMWEDYTRQQCIIRKNLENIGVDWYLEKIQGLQIYEQFLLDTYTKLNLKDWVQFVKYRQEKLQKELLELENMQNEEEQE
ncbi:unnamed protein product [Paramecium primaurelia]|uniref:C2 domain-containing protein n=1 Tax=Paramecium primaurelia TaxID=5886 RepID=A0A8S1JNJ7_PARPR|nr:unnamed protein product [Paramecium primaurelia]